MNQTIQVLQEFRQEVLRIGQSVSAPLPVEPGDIIRGTNGYFLVERINSIGTKVRLATCDEQGNKDGMWVENYRRALITKKDWAVVGFRDLSLWGRVSRYVNTMLSTGFPYNTFKNVL
ncbi:hypothetical protein GCM10028807_62850 [Spirosoma daeguense]